MILNFTPRRSTWNLWNTGGECISPVPLAVQEMIDDLDVIFQDSVCPVRIDPFNDMKPVQSFSSAFSGGNGTIDSIRQGEVYSFSSSVIGVSFCFSCVYWKI